MNRADAVPSSTVRRVAFRPVDYLSRSDFLDEWEHDYGPGQHVTFLGPTQRGKTRLSHELLGRVISPQHKAVLLAGKPPGRDRTMNDAARNLNLRVVEEWPPDWSWKDKRTNGYVLRPEHDMYDHKATKDHLAKHFARAMNANYASKKPVITVVDEAHHVQNNLGLKEEYEAPLMRGAPVNAVWSLIQRGRYMSYHAYCEPEHFFIAYDADADNRKRYADLGGVDPKYVEAITSELRTERIPITTPNGSQTTVTISEFLYIRRSGPDLMIVGMK